MTETYDSIGRTYDATRKADPKILEGLMDRLGRDMQDRILDVGCGSGNYTIALHNNGFKIEGIDISEEMLGKAREKAPHITWHVGDALALPFADGEFGAVLSVLATHHMKDVGIAFQQMARVTKSGGRLVLFTSTPNQMASFWLNHYLPEVVTVTGNAMLDLDSLHAKLETAGFSNISESPFIVDNSLQDFFLQCGKYRPELYLDPVVRAGISSFALFHDQKTLERGLRRLKEDIRTGIVQGIIKQYESVSRTTGDFLFVRAEKKA